MTILDNDRGYARPVEEVARICRTCRYWTPPTAIYYGTCHNTKAGLGAHIQADGDGTCRHHAMKPENARDLLTAQAQDQGLYDTTGGGE